MTNQEAIDCIKMAMAQIEWEYSMEYEVAFEKAIEALEKRITYKGEDIQTTDDEWVGVRCKCGNGVPYLMRFCGKCGQAIDWSEVE